MLSVALYMEDDVIQVAVGLRLGVALCAPHQCHHSRAKVDYHGTHGLHCTFSKGCHPRHAAINDIIKRVVKTPNNLEASTNRMASFPMEAPLFLG